MIPIRLETMYHQMQSKQLALVIENIEKFIQVKKNPENKKSSEENALEFKYEFILRSMTHVNDKYEGLPAKSVMQFVNEWTAESPGNSFFNLILGMAAYKNGDIEIAETRLLISAQSTNNPGIYLQEVKGQAGYALAILYKNKGDMKRAAAWLTYAITLENKDAEAVFFDNSFLPYSTILPRKLKSTGEKKIKSGSEGTLALITAIYLVTLVMGKRFDGIHLLKWLNHSPHENKNEIQDLIFANDIREAATVIGKRAYVLKDIGNNPFMHNQNVAFNFLIYCHVQRIIPNEIFIELMQVCTQVVTDQKIKNKAHVMLYKCSDKNLANVYLSKITPEFFATASSRYNLLDKLDDAFKYEIFKKLITAKKYFAALTVLNQITNYAVFDNDIFGAVYEMDPHADKYEMLDATINVFSGIVATAKDTKFVNIVQGELDKINNAKYIVSVAVATAKNHIQAFIEGRDKYNQTHKLQYGFARMFSDKPIMLDNYLDKLIMDLNYKRDPKYPMNYLNHIVKTFHEFLFDLQEFKAGDDEIKEITSRINYAEGIINNAKERVDELEKFEKQRMFSKAV